MFTGSPNWSARAARSDEVWVKLFDVPKMTRAYANHIDRLMTIQLDQGSNRSLRVKLREHKREQRAIQAARGVRGPLVAPWFELD